MKSYLIRTFAIIVAIICFSFTKMNKVLGCSLTDQYVWYSVDPSFNLNCAQFATVFQSQVIIGGHIAPTNNPLNDLTTAGYRLQFEGAEHAFGCEGVNKKLCAVAYSIVDVSTTKFERIEIPVGSGQFYWRPKTGVNRPTPHCAICKPE